MLTVFLFHIRPLYLSYAKKTASSQAEAALVDSTVLFTYRGRPIESRTDYDMFLTRLNRHLRTCYGGEDMTTKPVRQLAVALFRTLLKVGPELTEDDDEGDGDDEDDDGLGGPAVSSGSTAHRLGAAQRDHSVATEARQYGNIRTVDLPMAPELLVFGFLKVSSLLWKFYGLMVPRERAGMETGRNPRSQMQAPVNGAAAGRSTLQSTSILPVEILTAIEQTMDRKADITLAMINDLLSKLRFETGPVEAGFSEKNASLQDWYRELAVLRDFYRDREVEFRGPSQFQALCALRANNCDLLLNLGTGLGKTSLVLAMALHEQKNAWARKFKQCCTVMVSPFVALAELTFEEARDRGLDVLKFETATSSVELNSTFRAGLVVVSADVAVGPGFRDYLAKLKGAGVLTRVVIDEAHVLVTDAFEYRFPLLNTRCVFAGREENRLISVHKNSFFLITLSPTLLLPVPISFYRYLLPHGGVPFVFLSATMPPNLLPTLRSVTGSNVSKVIHEDTSDRPALAFRVSDDSCWNEKPSSTPFSPRTCLHYINHLRFGRWVAQN